MDSDQQRTRLYLAGVMSVLAIALPVLLARELGVSAADFHRVTSPLTLAVVAVFAILAVAFHRVQQARLRLILLENEDEN